MLKVNSQKLKLNHQQIYFDFSEKMEKTSSLDECWLIYQQEMANYGFCEIQYAVLVSENIDDSISYQYCWFMSSYRDEFMREFCKPVYFENDYSILWCKQNESILNWNNFNPKQFQSLTPKQIKCAELSWDFKIINGFSIPLRLYYPKSWCGVGLSATGINDYEFNKINYEYGRLIYQLTAVFHQAVQKFPFFLDQQGSFDKMVYLSEQQRRCLFLLSCGYQVSAIASKMKKSKRTIESYLQSAREQLDAKTITHAVSRSLLLRLLK
ncbi:MAG: LuxR C-terminal-related transcriptional regulator [Pseudomonadota bacterium]